MNLATVIGAVVGIGLLSGLIFYICTKVFKFKKTMILLIITGLYFVYTRTNSRTFNSSSYNIWGVVFVNIQINKTNLEVKIRFGLVTDKFENRPIYPQDCYNFSREC